MFEPFHALTSFPTYFPYLALTFVKNQRVLTIGFFIYIMYIILHLYVAISFHVYLMYIINSCTCDKKFFEFRRITNFKYLKKLIPKTIFFNVVNNFLMSNVLEWKQVCIMQLKGYFAKWKFFYIIIISNPRSLKIQPKLRIRCNSIPIWIPWYSLNFILNELWNFLKGNLDNVILLIISWRLKTFPLINKDTCAKAFHCHKCDHY